MEGCFFVIFLALALSLVCSIVVVIKKWPSWNQHKPTPQEKAWKLLEALLAPEQKEEAKNGAVITEKGKYGVYTIPLQKDNITFRSFSSMRYPFHLPVSGFEPMDFYPGASYNICHQDTVSYGPWYDAVATFLLYIRSGQELELISKAGNGNGRQLQVEDDYNWRGYRGDIDDGRV
ncbi:MAG: hypothetical protein AAB930_01220 [Patescibacteria group bacterium]